MSQPIDVVEALLFASDTPVEVGRIQEVLDLGSAAEARALVEDLKARYEAEERGLQNGEVGGGCPAGGGPRGAPHRPSPSVEKRLSKILAEAGLASRRASERLIAEGRVTVNGQAVTTPGATADPERDVVAGDAPPLPAAEPKRYVLLNKPRGYLTTRSDPRGRPVVLDLVKHDSGRPLPVGRVDRGARGRQPEAGGGGGGAAAARPPADWLAPPGAKDYTSADSRIVGGCQEPLWTWTNFVPGSMISTNRSSNSSTSAQKPPSGSESLSGVRICLTLFPSAKRRLFVACSA